MKRRTEAASGPVWPRTVSRRLVSQLCGHVCGARCAATDRGPRSGTVSTSSENVRGAVGADAQSGGARGRLLHFGGDRARVANGARSGLSGHAPAALPPQPGKRLVKAPKLYFLDVGLMAWLPGICDAAAIVMHASRGALFEIHVIGELVSSESTQDAPPISISGAITSAVKQMGCTKRRRACRRSKPGPAVHSAPRRRVAPGMVLLCRLRIILSDCTVSFLAGNAFGPFRRGLESR